MSISREQSISMVGDERYTGWGETEANADMNAKGLNSNSGSSSSSSSSGSSLSFDWDSAKAKALDELAPYYEKLLSMYKGNIALAKNQLDQDYERGLRVKSEETATDIATIEKNKAERQRKFQIALGDLDQTLNSRGILNSGIRTTDRGNATATENYEQGVLTDNETALQKALQYYKEDADATRTKQLEKWGMVTPTAATTSQYSASNNGVNTTGYNLSDYVSEPIQYSTSLDKQKEEDAITKAENAYNRANSLWNTQVKQLNS